MDNEDAPPSINFIPCVKWVKKGVAKEIPEKVELSKEELQDLIDQTKIELSTVQEEEKREACEKKENLSEDEYCFDQYDEEDSKQDALMGIGNLAVYSSNSGDPYVTIDDEDADSEKEDDIIKPEDNLILVGHVEGDASILEVYVYNEEEESLYCHHDYLLPAYPLCLEWLNHDPQEGKPGNLCAVGSMSSVIEVWDIDIINCLEPVYKLGHRGNKKKGITKYGHRDAVLDLSWNKNISHILASGSADQSVLLWDLDSAKYASKLTKPFEEKVQTLQWHPFEGQTLLVGSCDKVARVFDCRVEDAHKDWMVNGEVERVMWDHFSPFNFLVGTNSGSIHYVDCRNEKPVWELKAHDKEVTGLAFSSQCPGMMFTAGGDGCLKTWDILGGAPSLVYNQEKRLGSLLCLESCPDLPYIVAVGGDNKKLNFTVVDAFNSTAVQHRFADRKLVCAVKAEGEENNPVKIEKDAMETTDAMFESLSLDQPGTSKPTVKKFRSGGLKKKKKLKGKK